MEVIEWTNKKGYTFILAWDEAQQILDAIQKANKKDDEIEVNVESSW